MLGPSLVAALSLGARTQPNLATFVIDDTGVEAGTMTDDEAGVGEVFAINTTPADLEDPLERRFGGELPLGFNEHDAQHSNTWYDEGKHSGFAPNVLVARRGPQDVAPCRHAVPGDG